MALSLAGTPFSPTSPLDNVFRNAQVALSHARNALAAVLALIGVLGSERVAALAMCLPGVLRSWPKATQHILPDAHRFHVCRVNTGREAAQVVDVTSQWDRSDKPLIRNPMALDTWTKPVEEPVPVWIALAYPHPTRAKMRGTGWQGAIFVNLRPELLLCVILRVHRGPPIREPRPRVFQHRSGIFMCYDISILA